MPTESTPPRRPSPRGAVAGLLAVILVLALAGAAVVFLDPWGDTVRADGGTEEDPLAGHAYYANTAAVCGLLSPDELELALGFPFRPGVDAPLDTPQLHSVTGMTRCVYSSQVGGGGVVVTGVAYAYAEQVFDRAVSYREDRNIDLIKVEGLGDHAVRTESGDLLVLAGDKVFGINVAIDVPAEQDRWTHTRRLAEKAIERLK